MELLLWPLLPFLGELAGDDRKPGPQSALLWLGIGLGGAGWLLDGVLFAGVSGAWLSTGAFWAAASGYVFRHGRGERLQRREALLNQARRRERIAALEIELAGLKEEVEKYELEETRAFQIYGLAKSLNDSLSWDGLVNRFTQALQKLTGTADFLLYLASETSGNLELKWRSGVWIMETLPPPFPERRPRWTNVGREALLQVPLLQGDQPLGLLCLRWPDTAPRPSLEDIEKIFEHLMIGFQKAQLFARMESLSRTDGLTGVLRRQKFLEQMETEWNRARTFKTTFSLMFVDVDHFKSINDRFGHPAGDAVLAKLGRLLREGVYETDTVGRYGGEEFGILLSRTEPEGVRRKAETIRARVAAEPFEAGWERIAVTISVGLAHFPKDGRTVAEILESADKALYRAKAAGRNRVVDSGG